MIGFTKIIEQISKMQIKSITDPLFRYSLVMFILGTAAAIFNEKSWAGVILFSIAGLILLIALTFYIYFGITNPDYLRSESFQQNKKIIEILGDKDNTMNSNLKELKYIANPYANLIGSSNKSDLETNPNEL